MQMHRWMTCLAVLIAVGSFGAVASAQDRDADQMRMHAEPVDVGSTHVDELNPAEEDPHWRMIQLEEDHSLQLELDVQSIEGAATLMVLDATGEPLESVSTDGHSVTVDQSLHSGIYYIALESTDRLEYELSID